MERLRINDVLGEERLGTLILLFLTNTMVKKNLVDNNVKPDKYWYGILCGVIGGILGSLWITLWYRASDKGFDPVNVALAILSMLISIFFICTIYRKAFPNKNISERGARMTKKEYIDAFQYCDEREKTFTSSLITIFIVGIAILNEIVKQYGPVLFYILVSILVIKFLSDAPTFARNWILKSGYRNHTCFGFFINPIAFVFYEIYARFYKSVCGHSPKFVGDTTYEEFKERANDFKKICENKGIKI